MKSYAKHLKVFLTRFIWSLMAASAMVSIMNVGTFPLVKNKMLDYQPPKTECFDMECWASGPCVINGTTLGSEFGNVENFYTLPVCFFAFFVNFFLLLRICGSRFVNLHLSTFAFFCLIVFPVRFVFLAMQTLEFTKVGGDSYILMILDPDTYGCNLFSQKLDAVFLMHSRFFLLLADFISFHTLIATVPLFYSDDKIDINNKHRFGQDNALDAYTRAVAILFYSSL